MKSQGANHEHRTAASIALAVTLISISRLARPQPVPVTADNFIRAETDRTFAGIVKQGGFGKFEHYRELARDRRPASSSAPTATRSIRSACSISMPGR